MLWNEHSNRWRTEMDASFTKSGKRYTLLFERNLAHMPEKVWRVLTDRELLRQWFPCDVEGEWKVGAELRFAFLHGEGDGLSEDELRGEVLAVDPPKHLEFRWGDHFYLCNLTPEADGCRFIFSDSFEDASEGARNAAGWELCLSNLDLLLEGAALAKFALDHWKKNFERYAKKFEPEAGPQQGLPENFSMEVEETSPD